MVQSERNESLNFTSVVAPYLFDIFSHSLLERPNHDSVIRSLFIQKKLSISAIARHIQKSRDFVRRRLEQMGLYKLQSRRYCK